MLYESLIFLGLFAANAVSQVVDFRCGSDHPPASIVSLAAAQAKQELVEDASRSLPTWITDLLRRKIEVNTYVHIVTTAAKAGAYTDKQISDQISVINKAYNPYSVSFKYISTSRTVNDVWAQSLTDEDDLAMKTALRKGTYADLNLYFLSDLGGGLLGFCYFPTATTGTPLDTDLLLDGCVNLAGSLPGGEVNNYNLGGTAVHEVGHWFGLFHVFQGQSCEGEGDMVFDTPRQKNATRGCPQKQDSCPGPGLANLGLDSIHNYMDYSYDVCYTEFTYGQKRRMFKMYNEFRAKFLPKSFGW